MSDNVETKKLVWGMDIGKNQWARVRLDRHERWFCSHN